MAGGARCTCTARRNLDTQDVNTEIRANTEGIALGKEWSDARDNRLD